ncbi:MAG TPA: TolC family protein [Haliangium sp.]|nr:TolC family protein [Haliangium sp.]
MATTRPLDAAARAVSRTRRTLVLPAPAIALAALALGAGCVPSQQALYAPVHAQASERLGMSGPWRPGSPEASREVAALLQAPLTADSATRIALLNSATFEAALEELGARGGALAQAATPENPEIDVELLYPREGDESPHLEVQVVQSLTSLLAIPWRRGMARADLAAGRWRAVAAAVDLAAEARVAFHHALAATQILSLQRAIAEAAGLSVDLATRLHEAGNITDLALAQEQALLEQVRLDLADAELAARASRERLNATLGLWGEQTGWTISGDVEDMPAQPADLGQLESVAVARSLALAELRAEAESAAGAVGVARLSSWLPEIGVGVGGSREEGSWHVGPVLALSLPIFDLGQGERATAWARLRRARLQYRARAIAVRSEARAVGQRYQAARARAERLRDVVLPLRRRILDETVLQYNAMNASPFELLVARQQQMQASRQYIESLRDAWIAHVAIQQVRAGGSPRGGETPARATTDPTPQTRGH